MLEAYAAEAASCCAWLADQERHLVIEEKGARLTPQTPTELGDSWRDNMRENLPRIESLIARADLGIQDQLDRLSGQLEWSGVTCGEIERLMLALRLSTISALSRRWLFLVNPERVGYFKDPLVGWEKASAQFPRAIPDIEEAGKCLALERGTACVFHLMRVMELGLQDFATVLGVPRGIMEKPWGSILGNVDKAIAGLPSTSPAEKAYRNDCSEAAVHLRHVKDAWRNDVMHPRESYTPEQAQEVFVSVRPFMNSLAALL